MICGLLGEKLGHSYSPMIHSYFGDYEYNLYERSADQLAKFFATTKFRGINVTMPFKKAVIPYCTRLSASAEKLGSVNTIVRQTNGDLVGHNTDYFGFLSMLKKSGFQAAGKKALVLGSGGAGITAAAVLDELGADAVIISRSGDNNYQNLDKHHDAALIVNATPVGMYPNNGASPINLDPFLHLECVLDLIYNPARTKLLLDAEARGIACQNGLWMLISQARQAAELFMGEPIGEQLVADIYQKLSSQCENMVLIGMPGAGKSTIGKLLAQKLNKPFIDTDAQIEALANKSIAEIFSQDGEEMFRALESQVLADLCKCSGHVIATGGGCITKAENFTYLHQNSKIYWLQRDSEKIPLEGRPLFKKYSIDELYEARFPLYRQFADCVVLNDGTPEEAVEKIISLEVTT